MEYILKQIHKLFTKPYSYNQDSATVYKYNHKVIKTIDYTIIAGCSMIILLSLFGIYTQI